MSNMRIAFKNAVDHSQCVLTTDAASVTLPLDNLKNYIRGRIMRVPANPAFSIFGTYGGTGVYASMCSLLWHNFEPAGQWRFIGYSDAGWANLVVSNGIIAAMEADTLGDIDWGVEPLGSGVYDSLAGQQISTQWFARTKILSWALLLSDPGNSAGVIDAARLWVADYFELTYNPSYGMKFGWKEDTQAWPTDGGSVRTDAAVPYRQLTVDLEQMPEADRATWMELLRHVGLRKEVFVSIYPDGTSAQKRDYSFNGIITSMPDLSTVNPDRDSMTLTIREV